MCHIARNRSVLRARSVLIPQHLSHASSGVRCTLPGRGRFSEIPTCWLQGCARVWMAARSGTSLKIVEYFSCGSRGLPAPRGICAVRNGGNAHTLAARAFLQERIRISVQKEKGFSLQRERERGREREREAEKGWRTEREQRGRDECYEREKSVARENSAHIILPRYNEEMHVFEWRQQVFFYIIFLHYFAKVLPALTRGSDRSPAKSSNSGRFSNERRCHRICFQLRVVA